MATRTSSKDKASAPKAQKKPLKSKQDAPKRTIKPERSKQVLIKNKDIAWVWHGVLDSSLEARPLLRPLAQGERTMDYMVQAQHAPLPQQQGAQLTLRMRVQINVQNEPYVLAEMHYSGIVNEQLSEAKLGEVYNALYPFARQALLASLAITGHQPPLPEDFSELQQ